MSTNDLHARTTQERLLEVMEEFARRHGLEEDWHRWRRAELDVHEPPPPGAGIDYAGDMRDRRKGERRTGEVDWEQPDRRDGIDRREG